MVIINLDLNEYKGIKTDKLTYDVITSHYPIKQ